MQRQEEARQKIQENRRQRAEKKETERQTRNAGKLDADVIADRIEQRLGKLSPQDRAKLVKRVRETIHNATDLEKATSRKRFVQNLGRMSGVNIKLADLTRKGTVRSAPEGFYQSSTNTLVLDVHTTQGDAIYRVMLHELTHSIEGSGLYGEYANALLALKYGTGPEAQARINADTQAYMERYNRELPKLHEQDSSIDATPLTPEDAQKELVADLTFDVLFKKEGGGKNDVNTAAIKQLTREHEPIAKRIWSALTRFVRKLSGINDPAVTRIEQVRDMFARALEDARANRQTSEGRTQYAMPTDGSWLSDEYANPSSFEYMKSFREQLEDLMDPDTKELLGNDALLIGETPKILRDIGLPALPLTITQTHALYSIADTYQGNRSEKDDHKFSLNEFAKLPEKIADPIAVIAHSDPGKLLIYVSMKAKSGQQVIVPLVVDGYGKISGIDIDTHHVLTVHANEEMLQELQNAFEQDSQTDFRVYYFNKKRAAESGAGPRAQFSDTFPTGLIHKITDPESYVKMEIRSQTDTQQFKRWFRNSKVTDENGNPKVVYHGTASEFTVFEPQYVQNGETHPYFYFSNNREYAERRPKLFDSRAESHITEAYLSLQKPLYLESNGTRTVSEWQDVLDRAGIKAGENYVQSVADAYGTDQLYGWQLFRNDTGEFRDACEDAGYDGIITTEKNGDTTYVAFEPTQIKSATDNIGLFDPHNPDIRYSIPVDTVNESLREHGIEIDPSSGAAVQYSLRTAPKTDAEIEAAVERLVKSGLGFTEDESRAWLESLNTVSSIILQHMMELDYENDPRYSWLKTNSDYSQGSVDLNTNCPKRTQFTAIFDRLQKEFPNRVFTAQDYEAIRQKLIEEGVTVTCGPCFVEDRRQHTGEIAQGFIDQLNDGSLKQKFRKMIGDDTYVPTQYDLVTYEGFRKLYDEHRGIHNAFVAFNNARGMASARLVEGMAEYNNQIKKWSKRTIASKNSKGGLRIFSLSDADPRTMIDIIQITLDSAEKGLMIQGYTKKPWFARMVKDTGMRILRSHIPKGNGIRNGEIWYDDVEGINRFDKNYRDANGIDVAESSPNIGDNIIGINDEMIRLAMKTREIDQIIPFYSSLANMIRNQKKIGDWNNYKLDQTEKDAATGTVAEKQVNIYKDVINAWAAKGTPITNKVEFVNAFLEVCKKRGLIPRFAKFLNMENGEYVYTEGYEKFLVDYKLFDRDSGAIIPQVPVRAVFDDAFNRQVLEDYVNGVSEIVPANEGTYQAVRDMFADRVRYSLPAEELDDDYMAAVEAGEMDEAQRMVDQAAQKAGYTVKGYHGTANEFNVFDRSRSGENWQGDSRYGPGFYFAHDSYDAMQWTDGTRIVDAWLSLNNPLDLRGAAPDNIADAIRERTAAELEEYNPSWGITPEQYQENLSRIEALRIKNPASFLNSFKYGPDGKMTDGIGEFLRGLGYDGIITNEEIVVFDPNQIKSADPITYDNTGEVIPLSERFNDQDNDIRYSLPSDDLMDEMIRNYVGEELGEYGFPLNNSIQRAASYSQHADPHAPNNNPDHTQRMKSPQQIAKGLARKLNIGQAIGTRNMAGVPAQVLGFYEQRVRAIRIRNMNANSFVVGMHELGHGVAAQIGMHGTPEMIARLPALFAQNYSAAQLPGEAFAEFFWQYMTQENKAVPFAEQDFVDPVEQAMKDHRIYDAVQASRGEMLLWMNGSTMDRIRSVTRNRSDGVGKGIRDMMRTIVDSAVDSTYAAERVNAMIREQTK